jgi:hypothetical protein
VAEVHAVEAADGERGGRGGAWMAEDFHVSAVMECHGSFCQVRRICSTMGEPGKIIDEIKEKNDCFRQ